MLVGQVQAASRVPGKLAPPPKPGSTASLPQGWAEAKDASGATYFFNAAEGQHLDKPSNVTYLVSILSYGHKSHDMPFN